MDNSLRPSREAAMMLSTIADMSGDEVELIHDLGITITSTVTTITDSIEKPKRVKTNGCQVIHLGSHLFPAISALKDYLNSGELDLETYLRNLIIITDDLCDIVQNNHSVMAKPSVRKHMKRLINTVLVENEAIAVLNTMFSIIAREEDEGFPA